MATELQQQVQRLKAQAIVAAPLSRGRASLFLTEKEAAAVAASDVYEAAMGGLRALSQYDKRFEGYLDSILHSSSVDLQRELKTEEVCKLQFRSLLNPQSFPPLRRKIQF
jgi:hypothetical protein